MFNYDDLDVQQELSHIPPEYQDIFRQALEQELIDLGQDQTDTDVLHYLRRRRDDFRGGGFIRPDGRPGLVVADVEMLYEQGVFGAALGQRDEEQERERRRMWLKLAGLLALVVVFLAFAVRGHAGRLEGEEAEETPVSAAGAATPTPALPEVTGAGDSLQTIGGLGAALTIGRPSAIELHYGWTEEVIALAIDPSQATPRGELRYNEAVMRSDNPVAVWLFGTVVNYGIGLPDSLVRNLQVGDRILLSTDTGASLAFVVTETRQGASHDTAAVLSQNRPGMTLFALPAVAEDNVALALASYDVTTEGQHAGAIYEIGEPFPLPGWGEGQIESVHYAHTNEGALRIVVNAVKTIKRSSTPNSLLLSLSTSDEQTAAAVVEVAPGGSWQATFTLNGVAPGLPLYAELRALPGGGPTVVRLGKVPDLRDDLGVSVVGAYLVHSEEVVLWLTLHNPGEGAVYLGDDYVRLRWADEEGGEAYEISGQSVPPLPTLIEPGETRGVTVAFSPVIDAGQVEASGHRADTEYPFPLQFVIGAGLWEVTVAKEPPGPAWPAGSP